MKKREDPWWTDALNGVDDSRDYVILENPDIARRLDGLLLDRYWPFIRERLEESGYDYLPGEPETEFKEGPELTRSLAFMLFDINGMFFRGVLNCSTTGWMLEREFILSLGRENQAELIFEILGNSRLRGNPPTLTIDKQSKDFYQITLRNGDGAGWGRFGDDEVQKRIAGVIDASVAMHYMARDGFLPMDRAAEFLSVAYRAYEAY